MCIVSGDILLNKTSNHLAKCRSAIIARPKKIVWYGVSRSVYMYVRPALRRRRLLDVIDAC